MALPRPRQAGPTVNYLALGSSTGSGAFNLSGTGQLFSNGHQYIGYAGSGTLNQSGGTNSIFKNLYLGYNSVANGTYNLSGTGLLLANYGQVGGYVQHVGYSGTGTFLHSGTASAVFSILYLGTNAGANGTYNLSDNGQVSASTLHIGYRGNGTFVQSGGTNLVSNILDLGTSAGATGAYNLSSSGQLSGSNEYVGYAGTGTFTQSGGTNAIAGVLYLGTSAVPAARTTSAAPDNCWFPVPSTSAILVRAPSRSRGEPTLSRPSIWPRAPVPPGLITSTVDCCWLARSTQGPAPPPSTSAAGRYNPQAPSSPWCR